MAMYQTTHWRITQPSDLLLRRCQRYGWQYRAYGCAVDRVRMRGSRRARSILRSACRSFERRVQIVLDCQNSKRLQAIQLAMCAEDPMHFLDTYDPRVVGAGEAVLGCRKRAPTGTQWTIMKGTDFSMCP